MQPIVAFLVIKTVINHSIASKSHLVWLTCPCGLRLLTPNFACLPCHRSLTTKAARIFAILADVCISLCSRLRRHFVLEKRRGLLATKTAFRVLTVEAACANILCVLPQCHHLLLPGHAELVEWKSFLADATYYWLSSVARWDVHWVAVEADGIVNPASCSFGMVAFVETTRSSRSIFQKSTKITDNMTPRPASGTPWGRSGSPLGD